MLKVLSVKGTGVVLPPDGTLIQKLVSGVPGNRSFKIKFRGVWICHCCSMTLTEVLQVGQQTTERRAGESDIFPASRHATVPLRGHLGIYGSTDKGGWVPGKWPWLCKLCKLFTQASRWPWRQKLFTLGYGDVRALSSADTEPPASQIPFLSSLNCSPTALLFPVPL